VDGLDASYGRAHVLFAVSLEVGRGEVVALMGRNGAGKSTTLKAIMNLLEERRGRVVFRGADVSRLEPHHLARRGLGYVPEDRRIFTDLTVEENLEVGRQPARPGAPAWTLEKVFALFPSLAQARARGADQISGGEQQMLTVARTLMGNPYLVLLDEPSEGMAPIVVEQMARMIQDLKREGVSILLSEQNVRFAELVSDRAYVLEKGHVRYGGTMAALAADEDVRRTYLTV
jgi:branched-chain amino acid transport system ATP-binding protein